MSTYFCPSCGGEQMVAHPAGILTYQHGNGCGLRDLEDARKMADYELGRYFTRPATVTEKLLLASQGFTVPEPLNTECKFITTSVCNRSWPTLHPTTEEN